MRGASTTVLHGAASVRRTVRAVFRLPPRHLILAGLGGLLVAASLPPWGIWPLAIVGVAVFETALGDTARGRTRALTGWVFALTWLLPGMAWMWFLTAPGYLLASALFAGFHAVAAIAAPRGSWRVVGRPAAHTLAEAARFCFPFGGVPLASLAIGQAAGPFVGVVRVGGALLLTWFVFQVGFALAGPSPVVPQMARRRGVTANGQWHGVAALVAALTVWAISSFAGVPDLAENRSLDLLRVGVVQGGGPQGTHAIDTPANEVLDRHLAATATIAEGSVDMVLWPENVIDVERFEGSDALAKVAAEAARLKVPFVVGVTEDTADGNHFLNAQVVVNPDGTLGDRYEKVRRVPFGEYMPMRGLLSAIGAPTDLVPRDAVSGTGPALLTLPGGPSMAVAISWEVFFGGRVNEGVARGASFIINPTNGSSYTWTILQSQQVASSRLRAIEQGRWVVQAAPTGFSAFVSPSGDVQQRTGVSEQKVLIGSIDVTPRGRTWYSHTGNLPWTVVMMVLLAGSWLAARGGFRKREPESA
jgi:apolipoprotein N-acyltransferase